MEHPFDKEVKSFRLRLVNILKPYLNETCVLSIPNMYDSDVVKIECNSSRHTSVFKIFPRVRSILSLDQAHLVKYLSDSTTTLDRAIAKQILAEGTKKLRKLVPVYVKVLFWYQDKIDKKELESAERLREFQEKEEQKHLVRFANQVRRHVVTQFLSNGRPIPKLWINDELYDHQRLIENYNRDGAKIIEYYHE